MVLMAGIELPARAIREQIVSAIHLLVHVRRYDDGVRRIETVAELTGLDVCASNDCDQTPAIHITA